MNVYDDFKSYWGETSLEKLENFDFFANLPLNSQFLPENEPKGPQGPIGTPQDDKNYFFKLPGYENPRLGKRIFELSPIGKKLVWPYHAYGGHIGFSPIWGSTPRKNDGDSAENQSVYMSGQFKKIKLMQWGGCRFTPLAPPLIWLWYIRVGQKFSIKRPGVLKYVLIFTLKGSEIFFGQNWKPSRPTPTPLKAYGHSWFLPRKKWNPKILVLEKNFCHKKVASWWVMTFWKKKIFCRTPRKPPGGYFKDFRLILTILGFKELKMGQKRKFLSQISWS